MQRCEKLEHVVNVVHLYPRREDMRFRILVCLCAIDVMAYLEKVCSSRTARTTTRRKRSMNDGIDNDDDDVIESPTYAQRERERLMWDLLTC